MCSGSAVLKPFNPQFELVVLANQLGYKHILRSRYRNAWPFWGKLLS